jgi:hypothetical protein
MPIVGKGGLTCEVVGKVDLSTREGGSAADYDEAC